MQNQATEIEALKSKCSSANKTLEDAHSRVSVLEGKLEAQRDVHTQIVEELRTAAAGSSEAQAMELRAQIVSAVARERFPMQYLTHCACNLDE